MWVFFKPARPCRYVPQPCMYYLVCVLLMMGAAQQVQRYNKMDGYCDGNILHYCLTTECNENVEGCADAYVLFSIFCGINLFSPVFSCSIDGACAGFVLRVDRKSYKANVCELRVQSCRYYNLITDADGTAYYNKDRCLFVHISFVFLAFLFLSSISNRFTGRYTRTDRADCQGEYGRGIHDSYRWLPRQWDWQMLHMYTAAMRGPVSKYVPKSTLSVLLFMV